jgi:GxxExxY protein
MPIKVPSGLRRLNYEQFSQAAYEVMEVVFAVHKALGRLFDETIYQHEIARRLNGARIEVPIEVSYESFCKTYYLDLVFAGGALFELKAVEALVNRHRAQLLHYLLLADLLHGKLVNMRLEAVEHEFVNAAITREDRIRFAVEDRDFVNAGGGNCLREVTVAILRDWGVGLDIGLYEEVLTHFLGGCEKVQQPVGVFVDGSEAGNQVLRLAEPGVAFKISALGEGRQRYESHLRRFLAHTSLDCIQWINVGRRVVTFKTISGELKSRTRWTREL